MDSTLFIAPSAKVLGDVSVGKDSSVWFGAVLRADVGSVTVGERSSIEDNCVVHCEPGGKVVVGDDVTVGHGAVLHGCEIKDRVLVGMNATVLDDAVVGEDSIVGAGAVVPPGAEIPAGSLAVGVPAKVLRETTPQEREHITANAARYVELARKYLKTASI